MKNSECGCCNPNLVGLSRVRIFLHFLDTETGDIEVISVNMDSDEREEIADRLDDAPIGRYVRIDPHGSRVENGDTVDFADTVPDKALRRLLAVALDGRMKERVLSG